MDFRKLDKSIVGVVKEQQIKLGYRREKVRLYYPLSSLNRLLGTQYSSKQMQESMEQYQNQVSDKYGRMEISHVGERFCFVMPEQGSEYIHEHTGEDKFLVELIETLRKHEVIFEEVLAVFFRYSDKVHIEKLKQQEFDYLIFFEDGIPDDFIYCLNVDEEHIIYHRFTPDDYAAFLE